MLSTHQAGLRALPLLLVALLVCLSHPASAIKFTIPASRYPPARCVWNAAHPGALVVISANVGPGEGQRLDIEVVDSSEHKNVYLSKKAVSGEKRFAITAHAEEDVGVCFRNYLEAGVNDGKPRERVIDLDIDIGADAVDYNAMANQESLSTLETEMRKLEGVVEEIVDEMEYLKGREERFQSTNISTNNRVQKFGWFMIASLLGLGVWQILHLRAFFKRKYLID